MPNARSTYDANGTLRTTTDAPDYSLINLGRELINDRRSDYDYRRANRGLERPYGTVGSEPPRERPMLASAGIGDAGTDSTRKPFDPSLLPPPVKPVTGSAAMGLTSGPGYTMDPLAMNYYQRLMFLPQNSEMNGVIPSGADPGWEQFLAMAERRRAQQARGLA
jgi:hypothetical protein